MDAFSRRDSCGPRGTGYAIWRGCFLFFCGAYPFFIQSADYYREQQRNAAHSSHHNSSQHRSSNTYTPCQCTYVLSGRRAACDITYGGIPGTRYLIPGVGIGYNQVPRLCCDTSCTLTTTIYGSLLRYEYPYCCCTNCCKVALAQLQSHSLLCLCATWYHTS